MNQSEYRIQRGMKLWNIFFILFFVLVMSYFYKILSITGRIPERMHGFDILIISLAVFRMIRLFVYDNVFLFLREWLMDKTKVGDEIFFVESKSSLKRTLHKLALCPWCMGVWLSLCSVFVFFMFPGSYFLFLFLAISSVASMLQIYANHLGWHAEYKKIETERFSRNDN